VIILFYILIVVVPALLIGIVIGYRLRKGQPYHGVIKMIEREGTLVYTLELVSDPELLVFQDEVRFKVIPPNYEEMKELLSEGNS
jgi:hypothetical protein